MIRLLKIEWLKLRGYRAFWILAGLYALSLTGVLVGTKLFVDMVAEKGGDLGRIAVEFVPMLFKFPDIWPNLAYIAGYLNVIPAFLMVIVTGNEFSFRTARQNVIDGMSRGEFLASKLLAAGALAVVSTLLFSLIVVLMGTMSGGGSSPIMGIEAAGYRVRGYIRHNRRFSWSRHRHRYQRHRQRDLRSSGPKRRSGRCSQSTGASAWPGHRFELS